VKRTVQKAAAAVTETATRTGIETGTATRTGYQTATAATVMATAVEYNHRGTVAISYLSPIVNMAISYL